jgi:hypothetical protein
MTGEPNIVRCPLDSPYGGLLGTEAHYVTAPLGITVECVETCTGPAIEVTPRPVLFGKLGPVVNRTVQICPVTQQSHSRTISQDVFFPIPKP